MRSYLLAISCYLLVSSCALERAVPPATAGPLDSTLRAAGLPVGKIKFTGPVTFQIGGTGNVATSIAKAKGPVASAPHASATATKASTPWQVFALVAAAGLALGIWLSSKLGAVAWLRKLV